MMRGRAISASLPGLVRFNLILLGALSTAPALVAGPPAKYDLADVKALERAFVDFAEVVRPSVVAIRCYQFHDSENEGKVKIPISQGSGFIFDAKGAIATNNHVVEDAHLISVVLHNGMQYEAKLLQADKRSDLAVIGIEAEGLVAAKLGDLNAVRVNQWAFACGNPFGLAYDNNGKNSVTYGVVSALGRQMTHRLTGDTATHYYGNLIETSATINPGNSGGPLFNLEGEVIGVVTAIETTSGVNEGHGFAIPIDHDTKRVLATLGNGEAVRYSYIGIEVNDVEQPTTKRVSESSTRGAKVSRVSPPTGPAAKAGLQPKDVIIEFAGTPVQDSDHLVRLVQYSPVGSEVEVTYLRQQVKRKAKVVLADRVEIMALAQNK